MKTEKQIRAKMKQVIKNNNDLAKRLKEPAAIIVVYEYNLGMLDILEWVLEDEEGQRCIQRRIDDDARREYLEYRIEQDDWMWK